MATPTETRALLLAVRDEDGMLTCQKCNYHWQPTSVYPKLCPRCVQKWDSPAKWGKFARKNKSDTAR